MSMTVAIREGGVAWTQVLNASTSSTLYPSTTTAGVALGPTTLGGSPMGNRLHVAVEVNSTAGTSCTVAVLGLIGAGSGGLDSITSKWVHIGSLNAGSSIVATTSRWSDSTTHVFLAEVINTPPAAFDRFTTIVVQGSTNVVSTWVGVSRP